MNAPTPPDEIARLNDLRRYSVLDTKREKAYDNLTFVASQICEAPVSFVSMIDEYRQWFKATHGLPNSLTETARDNAFCAYNILEPDEIMVVADARLDERFGDNPLVAGEESLVFYAGAPLVSSRGHALGCLCVMDRKPKDLSDNQLEALRRLSYQVVQLLELRQSAAKCEEHKQQLRSAYTNLYNFSHTIAHDLKAPMRNIRQLLEIIEEDYGDALPPAGQELIQMATDLAGDTRRMVDGILAYSDAINLENAELEDIDLQGLLNELSTRLNMPERIEVLLEGPVRQVLSHLLALREILWNLIENAANYSDKEHTVITVSVTYFGSGYRFTVRDNGRGIAEREQRAIFTLFYTLDTERDRPGVGLSIVQRLVAMFGGEIGLESELGQGTTFWFTLK